MEVASESTKKVTVLFALSAAFNEILKGEKIASWLKAWAMLLISAKEFYNWNTDGMAAPLTQMMTYQYLTQAYMRLHNAISWS